MLLAAHVCQAIADSLPVRPEDWERFVVDHPVAPLPATSVDAAHPPPRASLSQNYPNPFNPLTTIAFTVDPPGHVSLKVYDVTGRLLRVLVDGHRDAQHYEVSWDGRDDRGREMASGIYFYRLKTGGHTQTRKAVLMK